MLLSCQILCQVHYTVFNIIGFKYKLWQFLLNTKTGLLPAYFFGFCLYFLYIYIITNIIFEIAIVLDRQIHF